MSQSIGQKLASARDKRGLSIDDVAHETRIPADILRHLEGDDYSEFANLTYAKSFLSMYSRHLSVDVSTFLKEFGPVSGNGVEGHAYLEPSSDADHGGAESFAPFAPPPRRFPVLLTLLLAGMLLAYPGLYMLGKRSGLKSAVQPGSQSNFATVTKPTAPEKPAPEKPAPQEPPATKPAATPTSPAPQRPAPPRPERTPPIIAKPSLLLEEEPPTVAVAATPFPPDERVVRPAALLTDPNRDPAPPSPLAPTRDPAPPTNTPPAPEAPAPPAEIPADSDPPPTDTPVDAPEPPAPAPDTTQLEPPEPEPAEAPAAKPSPSPKPATPSPARSKPLEDPPKLAEEEEEQPKEKERFLPRLNPFRKRGTGN